ncbi:MAG: acyltransferase [Tidjanibacter sp.]|nr:acyltransferase [Tidjanibacter sp.]
MLKVDVEQVLAQKAPKLAKRLPRFLINYLKKIVHQDEINEILADFGPLDPIEFIRSALNYMGVSYYAEGLENIKPGGRYLFAGNHPFGGMDGLMVAERVSSVLGDVRSVSNDILMVVEPLRPILLPVNKHGRQSREGAKIFEDCFASDVPIQTFPAGLCSRKIKGKVTDLEWRTNFVKKAIQYDRTIIPVHTEGSLSKRFYRIHRFRQIFGIKANLEMLFLVDEMFRQKGKNFKISFGKPIGVEELKAQGTPRQMTEYVRSKVYEMAQ